MTNRIRSMSVWLMIMMLATGSGTFSALAQDAVPLFEADGIEATVLAQADLAQPDAGSSLLLELLEIAPDTELATHQTTSSELFYVLGGVVTFQDDFGFVSAIEAGRVVSLNPGTEYTIANTESEPGRLLRLRIAGAAVATPGATPGAGDSDGTTVLMQAPLDGIEQKGTKMYLGRMQFGANSDSGEQGHAGPLGIYVDSGTLNVVSPSGLVGGIEAGRAVSLPAATPLRASTVDTEAVVFLAGFVGTEGEPFARIWSEADGTVPGSVLESGQPWQTQTAEVALDTKQFTKVISFNLTYTNIGSSSTEFALDKDTISVTDDSGRRWLFLRSDCADGIPLEAGASASCDVRFKPPSGMPLGPVGLTISVGQIGDIENAAWQMDIDW